MGRVDSRLWTLPSDTMRAVPRERIRIFFCPVANHVSECGGDLRCGHRHQVLRGRGKLLDHHWRSDARSCEWVCQRTRSRPLPSRQTFLGYSIHVCAPPFQIPALTSSSRLVVIPLSFLRRLDSLKYTSVVALISIGYLVILVVYHFSAGDTLQADRTPIRVIRWAGAVPTLSSFPVIVFAYTCHQNMFSILNEIGNNSHFQTTSVIFASNGIAAAIYILVAITGYLSFGNEIGGNIVAQYAPSVSATFGRAAIVVLVMFSYPLQVHPCRASIDAVLKWRPKSVSRNSGSTSLESSPPRNIPLLPTGRQRNDDSLTETRFAAITTAIIVLSFVVAITVESLEAVLAYVGSTGSTSISFILPGLFYYKISSPESALHQRLLKEEDDYDADIDDSHNDDDGEERDGLLGGSGILSSSMILLRNNTKAFRRKLLRRMSLALAIYGLLVMVVCLITNTFFIVAH
jgi:amino acid permease